MNFVLLGTFTLMEAFTLGVAVAFYENRIVIQALLITIGVFFGLTLFTFQSKVSSHLPGATSQAPFAFGERLLGIISQVSDNKKVGFQWASPILIRRFDGSRRYWPGWNLCPLLPDRRSRLCSWRMRHLLWVHRLRYLSHQQEA